MAYYDYMNRQLKNEQLCESTGFKQVERGSALPKGWRWLYVEELEIEGVWRSVLMEVHGFEDWEIDDM